MRTVYQPGENKVECPAKLGFFWVFGTGMLRFYRSDWSISLVKLLFLQEDVACALAWRR